MSSYNNISDKRVNDSDNAEFSNKKTQIPQKPLVTYYANAKLFSNPKTRIQQKPLVTYYANAKLFSRRIRKRPINKVSGLTKRVYNDDFVDEQNTSEKVKQKKLGRR